MRHDEIISELDDNLTPSTLNLEAPSALRSSTASGALAKKAWSLLLAGTLLRHAPL